MLLTVEKLERPAGQLVHLRADVWPAAGLGCGAPRLCGARTELRLAQARPALVRRYSVTGARHARLRLWRRGQELSDISAGQSKGIEPRIEPLVERSITVKNTRPGQVSPHTTHDLKRPFELQTLNPPAKSTTKGGGRQLGRRQTSVIIGEMAVR